MDASEGADSEQGALGFGLTFPLLTDSEGKKFGKSEGGAIWLRAEFLSPYQFYQYLFKTTDADVVRFLRMLTFLPLEVCGWISFPLPNLSHVCRAAVNAGLVPLQCKAAPTQEVAEIEASMARPDYVANTAQRRLAEEVTRFVHGEAGLQQAVKATQALAPGADTALDADTLEAIAGDAPSAELARDEVVGVALVDLVARVKLQPSKAAVRRLIQVRAGVIGVAVHSACVLQGGGLRLNNVKVEDEGLVVGDGDLIDGRVLLLAAGKKNKLLVRVL